MTEPKQPKLIDAFSEAGTRKARQTAETQLADLRRAGAALHFVQLLVNHDDEMSRNLRLYLLNEGVPVSNAQDMQNGLIDSRKLIETYTEQRETDAQLLQRPVHEPTQTQPEISE